MSRLVCLVMLVWTMNLVTCLAEEVVEFGNMMCPISGEEIAKDKEIKHEYKGINYNFCCEMCINDFNKDPEGYIKKMQVEKGLEEKKQVETAIHEHHH